jgi:hypothetical protein
LALSKSRRARSKLRATKSKRCARPQIFEDVAMLGLRHIAPKHMKTGATSFAFGRCTQFRAAFLKFFSFFGV